MIKMNKALENIVKNSNKKNWFFLSLILLSSLSVRFFLIPIDVPIKLDGIDYFYFAAELSKNGVFPNGILHTNDGWSIFLSPFFSLIGLNDFMNLIYLQRILSIIISTITIIPVYYLCRKYTNSNFSLIGVSIFAFHPRLIENSILGISEPLFIFLITLTILFTVLKNEKFIFIAAIFASFSSIVRYEGLLLFIPITIIFFLKHRKQKKNYLHYFVIIITTSLILLPVGYLRSQDNGVDGLLSHIFAGIKYSYNAQSISTEQNNAIGNSNSNFMYNLFFNLSKFLIWTSIPFFIFLVPLGLYFIIKSKNYDSIILLLFGLFLIIPASYAYAREFPEIRYLFVLFPIFAVFSSQSFELISNRFKKKWIFIIILIIFTYSIFYLYNNNEDYVFQKEIYLVTKHIINVADGVNTYSGNGFMKVATLESTWPKPLPLNEDGRTTYYVNKIAPDNSETLKEFLINSKQKNLTHLVVMENNPQPFLDDVFRNPDTYPYLHNTFDSNKLNFTNKILVFKINYDLLEKIEN